MCHEPVSSRGRSEFEIFHVGIEVTSGEHNELLRLERPLVGGQRLINYRIGPMKAVNKFEYRGGYKFANTVQHFRGRVRRSTVMHLSEASKVARCAAADWHAPDDWKRKVVQAIERSANVSRVFLLVARVDEGWVTIPSYANKNGPPRFEPMSKYEKWLARPLAVLPASDLLSFVYEKCEQIRRGSDNARSRKKP